MNLIAKLMRSKIGIQYRAASAAGINEAIILHTEATALVIELRWMMKANPALIRVGMADFFLKIVRMSPIVFLIEFAANTMLGAFEIVATILIGRGVFRTNSERPTTCRKVFVMARKP